MYKSYLLLAFFFLGCAIAAGQSTVQLQFAQGASAWWLAVAPQSDGGLTTKMEIKDSLDTAFNLMTANPGWGYYTYYTASGRAISLPATLRLTASSGASFTTTMTTIAAGQTVPTGGSYAAGGAAPAAPSTPAPTLAPTPAPPPVAATSRPATIAPTAGPTAGPTAAPAIVSPTNAPTLAATPRPSGAPTAQAQNLCAVTPTSSEPVKIMIPLYVYPGAAWDTIIAAANNTNTKMMAVINPNNGPLPTVDGPYTTYMAKLKSAGVEIVGYVHTSYGTRPIANVLADIDTYVSQYPLVTGIFLDEGATDASYLPYYTQAYNYIMSKPGYRDVVLNPGAVPDQGYLNISTNIVIVENYAANLGNITYPDWVKCAPSAAQKTGYKYKFTGIIHDSSVLQQASVISNLHSSGMGLVYVTDGLGGCCTYNALTSYYSVESLSVQTYNGPLGNLL